MGTTEHARPHLVVIRKRGDEAYVLRCFDCDWGWTLPDPALAQVTKEDHEHGMC